MFYQSLPALFALVGFLPALATPVAPASVDANHGLEQLDTHKSGLSHVAEAQYEGLSDSKVIQTSKVATIETWTRCRTSGVTTKEMKVSIDFNGANTKFRGIQNAENARFLTWQPDQYYGVMGRVGHQVCFNHGTSFCTLYYDGTLEADLMPPPQATRYFVTQMSVQERCGHACGQGEPSNCIVRPPDVSGPR